MKISGLDHLLIRVKDPGRTLVFYRDLLTLPCEVTGTDASPTQVKVGLGVGVSVLFSATQGGAPAAPCDLALSLQVVDPDVFASEAQARGLKIEKAPYDNMPTRTRRFTARDPDGLELHFERPLEPSRL